MNSSIILVFKKIILKKIVQFHQQIKIWAEYTSSIERTTNSTVTFILHMAHPNIIFQFRDVV